MLDIPILESFADDDIREDVAEELPKQKMVFVGS
jgi:hypothetical protein